jgi:hypothetical protein
MGGQRTDKIQALQRATFWVIRTDGRAPETAVRAADASMLEYTWEIGGEIIAGGPSLDYVFARPSKQVTVQVTIRPRDGVKIDGHPKGASFTWLGEIAPPERTIKKGLQPLGLRLVVQLGASAIAGFVAGLYWAGKPFGASVLDYGTLLLAGVGLDVSTNTAPFTALLQAARNLVPPRKTDA